MNLINPKILQKRFTNFDFPTDERAEQIAKNIAGWQTALRDRDLSKTKEKSVQGLFLQKFFGDILGYLPQTGGEAEWNLVQHPTSEVDAQEPDGSLGFFTKAEQFTRAVIELKDAKTSLDKKQSGREKGYTPIEQAYLYATKFDHCDWIVVSNFREIRLYNKSRTQAHFEKFDVLELHKESEFKRFYYLLCKQNLIVKSQSSVVDDLAHNTAAVSEDITKKFYAEYKTARLKLFLHLIEHNSSIDQTTLLEKAQTIIDRLIFTLFCEDTGNLLPGNLVKTTYELGTRSRERSDERVWREFKNLFMDIDVGRSDIDPKINKYNGGLFANDETLNDLSIKDTIWPSLVALNAYDFESELDVNILGHIFEQSISDLEALKTTIPITTEHQDILTTERGERLILEQEELSIVEKKGRRRKEGIFYTPDFITQYVVANVVGRFLEANPDKLESIKILDPACGSGAFLNQAHTFLMDEYKVRHDQKMLEQTNKRQLEFSDVNYAEINRSILLHNLFGVDLNPESVEITKLSLWLKTARSSEPLQNLDTNIKCGNSIVDDPEFAGSRALDWHKEFSDIMEDGKFDVIVGNPPYVRQELIREIKPYLEKKYKVYTGVSDLYVYFFEKALDLLKENGFFAFIVSSKFLRADYGKKLTQYLQQNYTILELIDFGDLQIFEGATTYPCIITIQKKRPSDVQQVQFLKLKSLDVVADLGLALKNDGQTIEIKKSDENWQLISIEEKQVLDKLQHDSIKLGTFMNDQIYYGLKTGFNEAFIIDEATKNKLCTENPQSSKVIKPILKGVNIGSYETHWEGEYLLYIPWHFPLHEDETIQGASDKAEAVFKTQYPAVYNHLLQFKSELSARNKDETGIRYEWYALQRFGSNYWKNFDKQKIIWGNLAIQASFSYDTNSFYINAPACLLPTQEKWLLAILNSSVATFFLRNTAIERQGGFIEQKPMYVKELPIPSVSSEMKELLLRNVESLLRLHKERKGMLEQSLEVLKNEYALRRITQKLENFLSLGWNEFIEELEKQQTLFSLQQKDQLNKWFRGKQQNFQKLENTLKKNDDSVNEEVYKLYHLSNNDIQIVLSSMQQQNIPKNLLKTAA